MGKTLIFTATYNEKTNIEALIKRIRIYDINSDILVIDDNSPDKTAETLKALQKNIDNLILIVREKKKGLDTAHKLAYEYAKKNNYNKFISLDADLSHDPKEIPKFKKILDNHSFVIGSRYIKGGSCEMSLPRLFLSVVGNKLIKFILQIDCDEFTTSFRGFNLEKLKNFDLSLVNSKGYSFFMETIFRLDKMGVKIVQVPIQFKNRAQGKSKIPKLELVRTLKNLLYLYIRN